MGCLETQTAKKTSSFVPRNTADLQIEPANGAADGALVTAFAQRFVDGADIFKTFQPYTARTVLGAHGRLWNVNCWALPAATQRADGPIALCMHGHGHSCCLTAWARFFAPLHEAGFNVIALDAPTFGRSGGTPRESGQANLWRTDDAALVTRLLAAFGVGQDSQRVHAFAQCMGGAMFLRALQAAPGLFGPFHVMHKYLHACMHACTHACVFLYVSLYVCLCE